VVSAGKALYKIADLSYVNLRAYITGDMLPQVKLGQKVNVLIDQRKNDYKTYEGTIIWIADKAEFTPKTIQTKEERANLVYAIKVKVKNDGFLKIGMYGEVQLTQNKK
jgi:HlyD family secretion protein